MGAEGRIGNRAALQGVANALKMEGVNRAPNFLNRDVVNVVYPLDAGGMSGRMIADGTITQTSVAGLSSPDNKLVGGAGVTPLVSNVGLESRVLGLNFMLDFDAAGALAFNGKFVDLQIYLYNPAKGTQITVVMGNTFATIATAKTSYRYAMGQLLNGALSSSCGWPGFIPSEYELWLRFLVVDGTAFPANTTLTYMIAVVQQPSNARVPL